jgi:hypothetical protein
VSTPKRCRIPFLSVIPEVRTSAGNIYSSRVLEIIFDELLPAKLPRVGCLDLQLDGKMRLAEVAFNLLAVDVPNSLFKFGDLEFLDTRNGRMAAQFYDGLLPLALAVRLLACRDADGRIDEVGLIVAGVDLIIPAEQIASPLDIIAREILSGDGQPDSYLVCP